jgi:uroporphyrinogen III methyltransferase/synthase
MEEKRGKVYLVGAGPGDPKLITVRGLEALRKSDAVVYDRLAGTGLLKEAKRDAELIYVGKLSDRHTMKQEEINRLLVELALAGKTVTRLKGGDPSIFGRVGEEAEALASHGIPFEIIPGVTSVSAVPAYAGIPITHRDFASSFAVITGHENADKLDQTIRWDKLATGADTLVFLMGVAKIDHIRRQLIRHGRPPETPVALIRWGTRAEQRTLAGTLGDIAEKVQAAGFEPPAVIVVGDVAKLREKLTWYEKKPLFGKRVMITRARGQAGELAGRIDELGGEPYEFPVIDIRPPSDPAAIRRLEEALGNLEQFEWVMFTSANGVRFFFENLVRRGVDVRRLASAKVAAVGPKTAEALRERGIVPLPLPADYQAEGLLEAVRPHLRRGDRVLLPRGDLGRDYLPVELERLGLTVTDVCVYENVPSEENADEMIQLLEQGAIHMITFTSSSTVQNLCRIIEKKTGRHPSALLGRAALVSIGPLTTETAAGLGLTVARTAEKSTIDALVEALVKEAAAGSTA